MDHFNPKVLKLDPSLMKFEDSVAELHTFF